MTKVQIEIDFEIYAWLMQETYNLGYASINDFLKVLEKEHSIKWDENI